MPRDAAAISRRRFLGVAGAAALAGSCTGSSTTATPTTAVAGTPTPTAVASDDGRDLLFVFIDDMNDWVGALGGHPQAQTPNIDALTASGALFTNAHAASPACVPSRAATLTGLAPTTTGVYGNLHVLRDAVPDVVTLPQHLRAEGVGASGTGKVFGTADPASWDRFLPDPCMQRPGDPRLPAGSWPLSGVDLGSRLIDWGPLEPDGQPMSDELVVEHAADLIASPVRGDRFIAAGLFRPHLPMYVPAHYFEPFPLHDVVLPAQRFGDLDDVPASARLRAQESMLATVDSTVGLRSLVQAYLAAIAFADDMVGRLVSAVAGGPRPGRTTIVLTTDHGWHLGEKETMAKGTLWEESTRVPLVIAGHDVAADVRRDDAVSLLDVFPTVCDLIGVEVPASVEGTSLVPLLDADAPPRAGAAVISRAQDSHAVRDDRWRLIVEQGKASQLYDHDVDPGEHDNVIDDPAHHDVIEQLAAHLASQPAAPGRSVRDPEPAVRPCAQPMPAPG